MPEVGVSKREFAARSSSYEVSRCEVTVPKCKHEIFVRIDMEHSYFSLFVCNQLLLKL